MARVNHKSIQKLINEERGAITDRQFFRSRMLAGHFEDIAAAQTKRYNCQNRVRVLVDWKPKDPQAAFTDNYSIFINAAHELVKRFKSRKERYDRIAGMFSHELGHIFFTSFLCLQSYVNYMMDRKWYPCIPKLISSRDKDNARQIMDYLAADETNRHKFLHVAKEMWNVLEDGYVEDQMLRRYPGKLGRALSILRQDFYEMLPTVTEMEESEDDGGHIWKSIEQCFLSYSRFGEIKYGDNSTKDPRVMAVFDCLDVVDVAMQSMSTEDRLSATNYILIHNWEYVLDYLNSVQLSPGQEASEAMSGPAGSTSIGSGTYEPVLSEEAAAKSAPAKPSPTAAKRSNTANEAKGASENEPAEDETADEGNEKAGADNEKADQEQTGSAEGDAEGAENALPGGSDGSQPANGSSDPERIPFHYTQEVSIPTGGTTEYDEEYDGEHYADSAKDIEKILDQMACESLEKKRTQTMNELAQNISYGDVHAGVQKTVHRIAVVEEELIDKYKRVAPELLHISEQLRRNITRQMQDRRRGGKQTGLYMGRRLDTHALPRNDGRVFYKTSLPNETPELAIALLVDESGSMSGSRIAYARASAVILYDFCKSLGIPIMIYGHSTRNGVDLYSYAEFEAIDRSDCYRLMDMSARGSNRDGAALRYVAERLVKRPEDVKILILISDGQPADYGCAPVKAFDLSA